MRDILILSEKAEGGCRWRLQGACYFKVVWGDLKCLQAVYECSKEVVEATVAALCFEAQVCDTKPDNV